MEELESKPYRYPGTPIEIRLNTPYSNDNFNLSAHLFMFIPMPKNEINNLNLLKFQPGDIHRNQISRSRLEHNVLMPSTAKAIFLHAPAGYGKTVLMTRIFNRVKEAGENAAWINCDINDREPEVFIESLTFALKTSGISIHGKANDLTDLLSTLDEQPNPLKIFIDEYELVCGTLVDEVFNRLVLVLPPHVQLIISTRKVPEKYYSRFELEGKVCTVDAQSLRFTDQEAQALLAENFNEKELHTVVNFAEGWPLVLQLANIKHQHLQNHQTIIELLNNPTSEAFSYLAQEVFSTLPSALQEFLTHCSILTNISVEIANTLTGKDDAFSQLSRLMELQPIITPVSSNPLAIKIHPLFREYLLQLLQQQGDQYRLNLHKKAALCYLNNNMMTEAIVQARLANDPGLIGTIIELSAGILIIVNQGAAATHSLLSMVPQTLIDKSITLSAIQTLLRVISGNGDIAEEQYQKFLTLKQKSNDSDQTDPDIELIDDILKIFLSLTRDLSQSISDYVSQQLDRVEIDIRQHHGVDPRVLCLMAAPKFLLLQRYGDTQQAQRSLREYETLSEIHGYANKLTAISPHLGLLAYNSGDFDQCIHYFSDRLSHHWDRFNQREQLMCQAGNAILARIHYERNELMLALANIDAIGTTPDATFIEIMEANSVSLARCWAAQGELERAINHLKECAHRAQLCGQHNMVLLINAALVSLLLKAGKIDEAEQLVEENSLLDVWKSEIQPGRILWLLLENLLRALAPLLIKQKRASIATELASQFCTKARLQGRHYMQVIGLVFQAKALISEGRESQALNHLSTAISHSTRQAITRPFIDAGSEIILLLEKVIASLDDEKQITHVQQINTVWSNQLREGKTSDILTAREQDVLTELAKGHPTKVIARHLDLSPETVKHHLKHIYAKLGVGNRKEAVTEAWRKAMFSS